MSAPEHVTHTYRNWEQLSQSSSSLLINCHSLQTKQMVSNLPLVVPILSGQVYELFREFHKHIKFFIETVLRHTSTENPVPGKLPGIFEFTNIADTYKFNVLLRAGGKYWVRRRISLCHMPQDNSWEQVMWKSNTHCWTMPIKNGLTAKWKSEESMGYIWEV